MFEKTRGNKVHQIRENLLDPDQVDVDNGDHNNSNCNS